MLGVTLLSLQSEIGQKSLFVLQHSWPKTNWLRMALIPIKPVVIPALTTMLDSSLVEDKSLCPVRALKVYLDKTKSMRKGKTLLFVSLRGYSRDITRITISQWIKQTIHTCYQSSDMTDQQVTHDVRAMAASLAFKGGVSLEQVLSSC